MLSKIKIFFQRLFQTPEEIFNENASWEDDELYNNPPPDGLYGVYAEPNGHMKEPQWLYYNPTSYEKAFAEADKMNRCNKSWNYYAKPLLKKQ